MRVGNSVFYLLKEEDRLLDSGQGCRVSRFGAYASHMRGEVVWKRTEKHSSGKKTGCR